MNPTDTDDTAKFAALVGMPSDAVLKATVLAMDAMYNPRTSAQVIDTTDGPIREPGDEQPKWHDVHTACELSELVDEIAVALVKQGKYEAATNLKDAAQALCDLDEQVDEARATVTRLVDEIADLRDQLAGYRVVETFPATRETPAEYEVRPVSRDEDSE